MQENDLNLKTLLLTFVCIVLFAVTSANAFQVTARKSNPDIKSPVRNSSRNFAGSSRAGLSTPIRRSEVGRPVNNLQQSFGAPMQSVIINGQVVVLPVTGAALLQQSQLQQTRQQQPVLPQIKTPATNVAASENTPAKTKPAPKPAPLRVKSKFFDAE